MPPLLKKESYDHRIPVGPSLNFSNGWISLKNSIFLPRSRFLKQQAGFKKKALGAGRKANFSVCDPVADVVHFPSFSTVSVEGGHSPRLLVV
jgi:hypothetical protein